MKEQLKLSLYNGSPLGQLGAIRKKSNPIQEIQAPENCDNVE